MAGSFTLPTVLANLTAGNQPLTLIDGDLNALANPLLALGTFGNYYADTGAANAYVITVPAPQTVALAAGLPIQFLATNANTGASTIQINALAAKNILHIDGSALVSGDIPAAGLVTVIYDGTQFQLQSKGKANAIEGVTPLTAAAGTNTVTATAAPVFAAYVAGQKFVLIPAATNTGATTLNINSLGAKNVFFGNAACIGGELMINVPILLMYDGTQFQAITPSLRTKVGNFSRDISLTTNLSITGVGFAPRSLRLFGAVNATNFFSLGSCDASLNQGAVGFVSASSWSPQTTNVLILLDSAGTNFNRFTVASLDSDGFTLSFSKTGTPTGTATILYEASR